MVSTKDEKEIQLAEDLQQKLKSIEDPSKYKPSTVDQTVVSPFDQERDRNLLGLSELTNKVKELDKPVVQPTEVVAEDQHPDPIKHKYISFVKSGFRIAAGFALALGYLQGAGLLLVLAEVLGIAEEMV